MEPGSSSRPSFLLYEPAVITLGRLMLTACTLVIGFGPFMLDFNETHVYNPTWPPHARFHNGQTITLAVLLGLLSNFLSYRNAAKPRSTSDTLSEDALRAAAEAQLDAEERDALAASAAGCLFAVSSLTGPLYPGAAGVDPQFGSGFPQLVPLLVLAVAPWVAFFLETTRISNQRLALAAKSAKWD